jgi:hypothetical protein
MPLFSITTAQVWFGEVGHGTPSLWWMSGLHHFHRWLIARRYVRRMTKRARTAALLLVAILAAGGTVTAIASTGSSSGTNPAPHDALPPGL